MAQPTKVPHYVRRFARLPHVLEVLTAYPNGLALDDLAEQVGAETAELREDLLAFYTAEVEPFGLERAQHGLEFLGSDGDDVDPNKAEVVRISGDLGLDELGVHHLTAGELALLYAAASRLQDLDPDDEHLAAAVDALAETMFDEPSTPEGEEHYAWEEFLAPLHEGISQRRKVRIVYSRAWYSGVSDRVIEPYRLVSTRRGWEVDAGPLDDAGVMRTFLLSNIREAELLDDTYEVPDDLEELLVRQRETARIRVRLPQAGRWAGDMYAEEVHVVDEDELVIALDLDLLPPLEHRLGLLMLAAGTSSEVVSPVDLAKTGPALAEELLAHHRRTTDSWDGRL